MCQLGPGLAAGKSQFIAAEVITLVFVCDPISDGLCCECADSA